LTAILGTSGDLSPLGTAIASALSHLATEVTQSPTMGTSVYLAVSGASAAFAADFAAGKHILRADIDVSYRINAAGVTTAAVWETSPAIWLQAGDTDVITIAADKRIVAITSGGSGVLMGVPIS